MPRHFSALIGPAALACLLYAPPAAFATGVDAPAVSHVDPAPCVAAAAAGDADAIIAACGPLIDNEKTARADRLKALLARGRAYTSKDQPDRAIADYDIALRLDPTLADIFNARGELRRGKGDFPRAIADFAAAIKLNPQHAAARANHKALAQELERLGAQMAIKNRASPSSTSPSSTSPPPTSPPLK
jgi:tetratricopeptide (TPR) repeat protein